MIFLKGFIVGLTIASPLGPVAILCIRRTLERGRNSGFVSGLGSATSDTISSAIAAFGVTAVTGMITSHQKPLRLIGGIVLTLFGLKLFFSDISKKKIKDTKKHSLIIDYTSTLLLTSSNPMSLLAFVAAFVGLGIIPSFNDAVIIVCGVATGSVLWWFFT